MKIRKGFTLIELLVVVSIIAILSAVGLASFQNARKKALDAKSKAEVKAYQQVLESKFNDTTNVYVAAVANDFENNVIPAGVTVTFNAGTTSYCAISAALQDVTSGNCSAGAAGVCTWAASSTNFCARNMR